MEDNKNNRNEVIKDFRNQNFKSIQKQCLKKRRLFEDPYFKLVENCVWMRPSEIVQDPQLYVQGVSRFDVLQGGLRDCWLVGAISILALYPSLVEFVVPKDQSFSKDYAGVFHFRIWRFGRWYEVVVDDRLPTVNGALGGARSQTPNEFWPALLQKAYHKIILGEYEENFDGHVGEALEDFTGGIVKEFYLRNPPSNFENILLRSANKRSLIGCFLHDKPQSNIYDLTPNHTYSVTAVKRVKLSSGSDTVLVRVRNAWGGLNEWKGWWSDNSSQWNDVPSEEKEKLGLVFEHDGESWMGYGDFLKFFEWGVICYLDVGVLSNVGQDILSWELMQTRGSWVRGVTAGGSTKMHMNTQVKLSLTERDDSNTDGQCSVVIALIQRPIDNKHLNYNKIGFKIYQLHDPRYNRTSLDPTYFKNNHSIAGASVKPLRERVKWFSFLPGVYCVIPHTDEFGKEGQFVLRIYTEKEAIMDTMDYPIGLSPEKVTDLETPPMKIIGENAKEGEDKLAKELCDQITGRNMELGWKELKNALDIAVKKNYLTSAEKGGEHVLIDMVNFVYNRFFRSHSEFNAFKTVGVGGFSKDICRSMVALLDVNHSGKLNANELHTLGEEIQKCKLIYELHSKDSGGYLNLTGLKEALETSGFLLNNRILGDIVHKYVDKDYNIPFDDFLYCVIKLKSMSEFFKSKEENDSHKAKFTFEEFIEKVMYS